jgi:hypothetical protein
MAKNSEKDRSMAAELKKRKVKRDVMLCPICHGVIAVTNAYAHIAFHNT